MVVMRLFGQVRAEIIYKRLGSFLLFWAESGRVQAEN